MGWIIPVTMHRQIIVPWIFFSLKDTFEKADNHLFSKSKFQTKRQTFRLKRMDEKYKQMTILLCLVLFMYIDSREIILLWQADTTDITFSVPDVEKSQINHSLF